MACSSITNYVPGRYTGCAPTARSICDWLVNHSGGVFYFNGCFGYKKIAGTSTVSVHATGRAIDISIRNPRVGSNQNNLMKFLINAYIMPNVCGAAGTTDLGLGIQRMIFEGRIWESGMGRNIPHAQWRVLRSGANHNDHLHLEVSVPTQNKFRYNDVNALFFVSNLAGDFNVFKPFPTTDPVTDPVPVPTAPQPWESGSGASEGSTGGTGGGTGAGTTYVTPAVTETAPVWSTTIPELGPCAACGEFFEDLESGDVIQITHCSGTGAICINKLNGMTCSTGTAPDLGNFPGPIQDFLFWGNGAYALSTDGYTVYNVGDAVPVTFTGGPWTNLYAVSPSVLAVSTITKIGFTSARATVNSIATHTCCG